jgi:hypothetical protein
MDGSVISAVQNLTLTAGFSDSGQRNVTLVVSDWYASATKQWNLTVNDVDRLPEWITVPENATMDEDSASWQTLNASDPDGDIIIYYTNDTSFYVNGSNFTLAPEKDWNGIRQILVTASDGKANISQVSVVNVTAVNDAPVIDQLGTVYVTRPSPVTITPVAHDAENDSIIFVISESRFSWYGQSFIWTNPDSGTFGINITASDGNATGWTIVDVRISDPAPVYTSSGGGGYVSPAISKNMTVLQVKPIQTACREEWNCSSWSVCSNGTARRSCLDIGKCGILNGKPAESKPCSEELRVLTLSAKAPSIRTPTGFSLAATAAEWTAIAATTLAVCAALILRKRGQKSKKMKKLFILKHRI